MTRFPREPLDAEERALAARLPRPKGRGEPGAALDARILAAAHAAAAGPAPAPARPRRWLLPVGLAASLCLALGLAWRVQLTPPVALPTTIDAEPQQAQAPPSKADSVLPEDRVAAPQRPSPPTPAAPARSRAAADAAPMREQVPQAIDIAPSPTAFETAPAPPPMAALPAPPAPPVATAASASRTLAAEAPPPAARAAAPPRPAMAAKARAAESAALADDAASDAPEADIPPATADAPEVRDAWLRRIGELQRDGRTAEARASLVEFRRRYPEAVLPAELRALESPQPQPASR